MSPLRKPSYANITKVRAYVKLARDLDIDVTGFEVFPDGAIRVFDARAAASSEPVTDFDRYKDEL